MIQRIKKGERRKAWLRCDRDEEPEKNSKSLNKRATGSRLIKCPYKVIAMLGLEGWVLSVEMDYITTNSLSQVISASIRIHLLPRHFTTAPVHA